MKILKRNQLTILVISLMFIMAGYLSFSSKNIDENSIAARDDINIGDAELVSANVVQEENVEKENMIEESKEEIIETSINMEENNEDNYFEKSKLERNSMYSELLETYQEIYNNVNSTNEQKVDALNKITHINNTKNAIMISENLITAKGFENVIVFANNDSISVVVKANELTGEQVAQIQNIISRELNVEANNIHISNK